MVMRTLLSVTSYVHCLRCLICFQLSVQRYFTTQTSHISLPMTSSVLLNTTFLCKECSIFITVCLPSTNVNWNIISLTTFILYPPMELRPNAGQVSSFLRFLDHTHSKTLLDGWSARRRDFYLKTHNIQKRKIYRPPAGFESSIPAGERLQTHALDRAATGTGLSTLCLSTLKVF
jgi:hypothetical protein